MGTQVVDIQTAELSERPHSAVRGSKYIKNVWSRSRQ